MSFLNLNRDAFFEGYRSAFGPIKVDAVVGLYDVVSFINIDREVDEWQFDLTIQQWAYVLATIKHETGDLFAPVKEAHWLSEEWRRKNLRYYPYYGRGHIQLTWKANYVRASELLGVDVVANPNLLVQDDFASWHVAVHGMKHGWFTGQRLDQHINDRKVDYFNARRIVNGMDRAELIASYAHKFEDILTAANRPLPVMADPVVTPRPEPQPEIKPSFWDWLVRLFTS